MKEVWYCTETQQLWIINTYEELEENVHVEYDEQIHGMLPDQMVDRMIAMGVIEFVGDF